MTSIVKQADTLYSDKRQLKSFQFIFVETDFSLTWDPYLR